MAAAPQPNWFKDHWPYLLGALILHIGIAALFGLAMRNWQRNAPPPTLAIEAFVVDANQLAKVAPPPRDLERERREVEARAAEQKRREEEAAQLKAEQERQQRELEQERMRQEQVARERAEQERIAQQKAAEEKQAQERRQQEEAERQRKLEAERQAKLEAERQAKLEAEKKAQAEAERKRVEEIQRKQREREEAERKRLAAEAEARERALREQLAAEEELMSARSSGAMSQYVAMIQQHVERRWIRPPSARSGIECEVSVVQSPSGTVLRVAVGRCNGDQAVRQSIENAVQKASPLPLPSDMRLFERNLQFIFRPAD
jgi:colicin import membrane protein